MKSMRNATGLGPGAGLDALCRFRVTLSPQSPGFSAAQRVDQGSGDPPKPSPTPLSLPPFTEPIASRRRCRHKEPAALIGGRPGKRRWGKGRGAGAIAPVQNLHSTTTPRENPRPVELCVCHERSRRCFQE